MHCRNKRSIAIVDVLLGFENIGSGKDTVDDLAPLGMEFLVYHGEVVWILGYLQPYQPSILDERHNGDLTYKSRRGMEGRSQSIKSS